MEKIKNITDHQTLMDEVYAYWNEGLDDRTRISSAEHFGPLHVIAVRLGNFNYQVGNGGTRQWVDNGYAVEDIKPLLEFFKKSLVFEKEIREENSVHISALEDIITILSSIIEHSDPDEEEWIIDCSYCDGSGEEEEAYEEDGETVYDTSTCFHCGGSGTEKTKDYNESLNYFDFKEIEQKTILRKFPDASSFYVWEKSLFQELLDNFEEIENVKNWR